MKTRTIGQNLEVSAIGLGCMGLNFGLGPATDRTEAIAVTRSTRASRLAARSEMLPLSIGSRHVGNEHDVVASVGTEEHWKMACSLLDHRWENPSPLWMNSILFPNGSAA